MSSEPNHYELGVPVTVSVIFQSPAGQAFDPDTITCKILAPGSPEADFVFGIDSAVIRGPLPWEDQNSDPTGKYRMLVETPVPGRYVYRWEGLDAVLIAGERTFYVNDSYFA